MEQMAPLAPAHGPSSPLIHLESRSSKKNVAFALTTGTGVSRMQPTQLTTEACGLENVSRFIVKGTSCPSQCHLKSPLQAFSYLESRETRGDELLVPPYLVFRP